MNSSKKLLIPLLLSLFVVSNTTQAMEQNSEFYNEKSEMFFLMQAIEQKELGTLEKMVVEKKVAVKVVNNYLCSRKNCKYETSHEKRITTHQEMHRLQDALPHIIMHRCKTCDYLTNTKRSINNHKNSHKDKKQHYFYCEVCDTSFSAAKSKSRHERESEKHKENMRKADRFW